MARALPPVSFHSVRPLQVDSPAEVFFADVGGADNVVIIWKSSGQGLLKYNHSAPIQKIAFNPTSIMLASCSEVSLHQSFHGHGLSIFDLIHHRLYCSG